MSVEKYPVDPKTRRWPKAGSSTKVDLASSQARDVRFFLDIRENKRRSSIALGMEVDRKVTVQCRGPQVLVRVDVAREPEVLRHHNPDGTVVVGNHVHLNVDGKGNGDRWAFPIDGQEIVAIADQNMPGVILEMVRGIETSCSIKGLNLSDPPLF